ncbi:hypothetical protein Taro_042512 [Colocasia esculenta]|uniref:Uncharacterized protein n=1 Tax=Colocasia esculenta TaxID=4460 RepID=A0A843WIM7_COLES|nr:hypothetical protein [Colocasia esculenta]
MKDEDGWVRGTGCLMVGGAGGAEEGDGGEERVGVARDEVSGALEARRVLKTLKLTLVLLTPKLMALLAEILELMTLLALELEALVALELEALVALELEALVAEEQQLMRLRWWAKNLPHQLQLLPSELLKDEIQSPQQLEPCARPASRASSLYAQPSAAPDMMSEWASIKKELQEMRRQVDHRQHHDVHMPNFNGLWVPSPSKLTKYRKYNG